MRQYRLPTSTTGWRNAPARELGRSGVAAGRSKNRFFSLYLFKASLFSNNHSDYNAVIPAGMPESSVQGWQASSYEKTCRQARLKVMRECKACLAMARASKASLALQAYFQTPDKIRVHHF